MFCLLSNIILLPPSSVLKFLRVTPPPTPSTTLIFTCQMLARTTLREVLTASISMYRGKGHHSTQSSLAKVCWKQLLISRSFTHSLLLLPLAAQGPPTWRCWQQFRTRLQCVPPTTPTRWLGNAWPRLQRTLANVGPKSSNRVAATEVKYPWNPIQSATRLGIKHHHCPTLLQINPGIFICLETNWIISLVPVQSAITIDCCGAVLSRSVAVQGQRSWVQQCFIYTQAAIQ